MDKAHLTLSVAALVSGLLGTFYVSAQALGFENLRKLSSAMLAFVDRVVAVQYLTQGGMNPLTAIHKQLLNLSTLPLHKVVWGILGLMLRVDAIILWVIVNSVIIHTILGIAVATAWLVLVFQLGPNLSTRATIGIAVVIWLIVGNILGEIPHHAVTKFARTCAGVLRSHFEWIIANTKEGGKTGIVGFFLLSIAIICQFAIEILD